MNIAQGKKSVNTSNTPILFAYSGKTLRNGQVTSPKIKDIAVYSIYYEDLRHECTLRCQFRISFVLCQHNAFRAFELLILVNRSFLFKETFATLKSFLSTEAVDDMSLTSRIQALNGKLWKAIEVCEK